MGGREEREGEERSRKKERTDGMNVVFVADLFAVITSWQKRLHLQGQTEQRRLYWHWIPELDRYISSRR